MDMATDTPNSEGNTMTDTQNNTPRLAGAFRWVIRYHDSNGNKFRATSRTEPTRRVLRGSVLVTFVDRDGAGVDENIHVVDASLVDSIQRQQRDTLYCEWHNV